MSKRKTPEPVMTEADKLRRAYFGLKYAAEAMAKTFDTCGAPFCNIGGGPCSECSEKRWEALIWLRSALKNSPL